MRPLIIPTIAVAVMACVPAVASDRERDPRSSPRTIVIEPRSGQPLDVLRDGWRADEYARIRRQAAFCDTLRSEFDRWLCLQRLRTQ